MTASPISDDLRNATLDAGELQRHMTGTYFSLRIGMGVIAALLPLVLWLGGRFADAEPLRCSMSAYYYSPAMRDAFVGALVAIGAFLYLYRGFSVAENRALNLAGTCAVGIAMIPTDPACGVGARSFTVHATVAVLFFLCIAFVCVFRASDTLSLIRDTGTAGRFRHTYRLLGIGMVVSPLIAVALTFVLQPNREQRSLVFFVEAVAVWMFAAYWLTKSAELRATDAERLALERKLHRADAPMAAAPGKVVQVEPPSGL